MGKLTRSKGFKWTLRIVLGFLLIVALTATIAFVLFSSWRADHLRALESGSKIAATARGNIEYAVAGSGVPYLIIHGSPGGYENGLAGRNAYPDSYENVLTITASRPGFLRTPLDSGRTFEEQADLFVALLDELKIDRAVIFAGSGGGYIGLQVALRHPERCIGLVMLSPSVKHEADAEGPPPSAMWTPMEFAMWAAGPFMGSMMMKDFNRDDARQVAMMNALMPIPIAERVPGALNDGLQRKDPKIDQWPLEQITVPTLLIHGNADENSIYEGSVQVAAKIPNSKLITFEGGDHYIPITHLPEVQRHIREFVRAIDSH